MAGSCVLSSRRALPSLPDGPFSLTLKAQFSIPTGERLPFESTLRFGGLSGLLPLPGGREVLALSDDQSGTRLYRIGLVITEGTFGVSVLDFLSLERPHEPPYDLDPEGLALDPDGNFVVSSEGVGNVEPRIPPAIVVFGSRGHYIRQIQVRDRFLPNPTGPLVKGVRPNFGFEALATTADRKRLFTASETALVQDGEISSVDRGASARLLEYVWHDDSYTPRREFIYPLEPLPKPPFEIGLAVSGIVDLIALDAERLLGMERTYVEEAGQRGRGLNTIKIFRIDLAGATDVSEVESLKAAQSATPVTKTPLLNLSDVKGLSTDLAPSLDNFEAMAIGPRLPDGRVSFLLVSDDNFNQTQRTWFLLFAVDKPGTAPQVQ